MRIFSPRVGFILMILIPWMATITAGTPGDVIAHVSALFTFTVDPTTVSTQILDRIAVAYNRSLNSEMNAKSFRISAIDGLGVDPCPQLGTPLPGAVEAITTGCHRVHFDVLGFSNLSQYEVKYYTEFWPYTFASLASDKNGGFRVDVPPASVEGPAQTWMGGLEYTNTTFATWLRRSFPQDSWIKQSPDCVSGKSCDFINIAPSARYQHSAVVYRSWNFSRDVFGHNALCTIGQDNSGCTESCLTKDPTCFGASDWSDYYQNNANSYLWGNFKQFSSDDGLAYPTTDAHSASCPPACCGTRRLCMRTHDDMGRQVPFDRSYLLIFGGRTRQKATVNGLDVYLKCSELATNTSDQTYASCLEYQSEELWRYDISANLWELLKPRSFNGKTFPAGRYGHSAALVTIEARNDLQATRRQYMFVFGGFSTDCSGGICSDLWRYEIPWAAQAFWPATSQTLTGWNRGNVWKKMASSPIGGLFRHSMVATESGSALIVYGGQQAGNYTDFLLVYTLSSDSWEVKQAAGYKYFTRSVVDYLGNAVEVEISDMSKFVQGDKLGPIRTRENGGNLPLQRADHCSLILSSGDASSSQSVLIYNGFRTYGAPYPTPSGGPFPTYPYYLDQDMWTYNLSTNTWGQVFTTASYPEARRGSSCMLLPRDAGDDLLLVFAGNQGDTLFKDFWILDVQSERKWRRVDGRWNGTLPEPVTYHTSVYDATTDQVVIFGGLKWTSSDLTSTDQLVEEDRRCRTTAMNLLTFACSGSAAVGGRFATIEACAVASAKYDISTKCNAPDSSSSTFCCSVSLDSIDTLQGMSSACLQECESNAFKGEFSANFGQGVWVMAPNSCANDCSGNGQCELSVCACKPGFTGNDCSIRKCPGSFCYFDSSSLNQYCVECSSNGVCGGDGSCQCESGWTGADCSMATCPGSCSGAGTCLDAEFPVNQCICAPTYSGYDCAERLCLNACSYRGTCNMDGTCTCDENFYGEDCSVYVFTADAMNKGGGLLALVLATLVLVSI